jgi:hypothetical protein
MKIVIDDESTDSHDDVCTTLDEDNVWDSSFKPRPLVSKGIGKLGDWEKYTKVGFA